MSRLDAPIDIICNLTLKCATSCIYCYADRKGNSTKHMDSTNGIIPDISCPKASTIRRDISID